MMMLWSVMLLFVVTPALVLPLVDANIQSLKVLSIKGVVGGSVRLPCNAGGDAAEMTLELWYKDQSHKPFYIYDYRDKSRPNHVITTDSVSNRSQLSVDPEDHYLLLNELELQDAGTYRCRIHYRQLPTAYHVVNLTLIARPFVKISESTEKYYDGRTYDIMCTSKWFPPGTVLTWWMGGQKLKSDADQKMLGVNVCWSVLRLVANSSHHNKVIVCRAEIPNVADQTVQDELKLFVQYAPKLVAKLRENKDITEGDDVYFDCIIDSNPPIYNITWRHLVKGVATDLPKGALFVGNSLVLQRVDRSYTGAYTCEGGNAVGRSRSRRGQLIVQYAPICLPGIRTAYGVDYGEMTKVYCAATGIPRPWRRYTWKFNNTAESFSVPKGSITDGWWDSILDYTPISDLDYGTLQCMAENEVGIQKEPCVFQIVHPARPLPPNDCKVTNVNHSSLSVECTAGYGGGISQKFFMEVYSDQPNVLQANVSEYEPRFFVYGMESGAELHLTLYSGNSRGRSRDVTRLTIHLPSLPVKQLETRHDTEVNYSVVDVNPDGNDTSKGLILSVAAIAVVLVVLVMSLLLKNVCSRINGSGNSDDDKANFRQSNMAACYADAPLIGDNKK